MAFGVTGFAALRLEPQPQAFQALSIGAQGPVPPAPPYGTPNQNLVPVNQPVAPALPANLTLTAQPFFQAILRINPAVAGAPNTTSSVGALNLSVTQIGTAAISQPPAATNTSSNAAAASGTVTFSTNSPATSALSIAVGTRVQTSSGTQFTVVADTSKPGYSAAQNAYVIAPGSSSVDATVQAVVTGSSGNVAAQSITQFSSPGPAPSGIANVTNVTAFATGTDAGAQSPLLANLQGAISSAVAQINSNVNQSAPTQPQGAVSFSLTVAPASTTSGAQAVAQTPAPPAPQLDHELQKAAAAPQAPSSPAPNAPLPNLDHELQKALAAYAPAPQPAPTSAPSIPPSSSPQFVLPANGSAVARIVATVTQLAVSAVYPAPVFSFAA